MNRVILKEQQKLADEEDAENEEEPEKESTTLTRTYLQALNLFLPPGRDPPREMEQNEDISEDLLNKVSTPNEPSNVPLSHSESSNQLNDSFSESPTKK